MGLTAYHPSGAQNFLVAPNLKKKNVPSSIHINYESTKLSRVFMCNAVIPYHDLFPTVSTISRKCGEMTMTAKSNKMRQQKNGLLRSSSEHFLSTHPHLKA